MVNTALAVRAGGEASATLDAFTADLYSGEALLYQGGGCAQLPCARGQGGSVRDAERAHRHSGRGAGEICPAVCEPGDTWCCVGRRCWPPASASWPACWRQTVKSRPAEMAQAAVDAVKEKLRQPDDITVLAVRFAAAEGA